MKREGLRKNRWAVSGAGRISGKLFAGEW